jgi:hypothetical protein
VRKRILFLFILIIAALLVTACGRTYQNKALVQDQNAINSDLGRLQRAEPLPHLKDSGDLRIQNYYYTAEADPNKIWYLVTQGMNGNPTGYYTIRGPVENVSDQVTNPNQLVCNHFPHNNGCDAGVIGLAEPNGIYPGQSNDHLAVLTDGAILRWEGQYQTSDQPFKPIQTPSVAINENAPISGTDTTKSQGGLRPPQQP